jgi:cyclopropane-fatty-acyl-phospholipid synthase
MSQTALKEMAGNLLGKAGITINGNSPWDIQVYDERFYNRVLSQGSLGLGEAYMDKWWDCGELDEFFNKLLRASLEKKVKGDWKLFLQTGKAFIFNMQAGKRAYAIGKSHYDLGNDLYQAMLDKRLTYTCGYWKDANNLDEAQEEKLDLVCRKLRLQEGQRILDIGCGWGSFAKFAAEKYKVSVVGITISKEQASLATELCHGLPVEIRVQDYRDVYETFDQIVSLGMFEHVGYKNYRTYMNMAARCLKDDGLFLLHTIGGNTSGKITDLWLNKYIFPNSLIPSIKQIAEASEEFFIMEDWHNFGTYYDKTLLTWFKNFDSNWEKLKDKYDERFYRMWKYYLLCCAGSFRARKNQLWQIVFSKKGVEGGYNSIR